MNSVVEHKTNPEFADAVGITRSMASRLRSGDRRPSTRVAHRILDALCPPDRYAEGMKAFAESGEAQERFLATLIGPVIPE